jgi:hypothetical protein
VATLVAGNANESTIESGGRGTGAKARKKIQQPMPVMLDECTVSAMRNNIIATLVVRNVNKATAVPMLGTGGSMESRVMWSVLCWCVWKEDGLSFCKDVFTFCLVYKQIYCTSFCFK